MKRLTGEYTGSYDGFKEELKGNMNKPEMTFDEADKIADKIIARKAKKNGSR